MKKGLLSLILFILPFQVFAQKLTLGSCTISEGQGANRITGQYKGEMSAGKPQGKGSVKYQNGNTYEGEFVKENAKVMAYTLLQMVRSMKDSGFKTNSMVVVLIILPTIINM